MSADDANYDENYIRTSDDEDATIKSLTDTLSGFNVKVKSGKKLTATLKKKIGRPKKLDLINNEEPTVEIINALNLKAKNIETYDSIACGDIDGKLNILLKKWTMLVIT
jgi:hypothetical protein